MTTKITKTRFLDMNCVDNSAGDTFSDDSYSRNDIAIISKENKSKVIVMNKKSYFYKNEYLLSIILKKFSAFLQN